MTAGLRKFLLVFACLLFVDGCRAQEWGADLDNRPWIFDLKGNATLIWSRAYSNRLDIDEYDHFYRLRLDANSKYRNKLSFRVKGDFVLDERPDLYRAYMTWDTDAIRVDAGKQRIAWGVMRMWRPSDLLNPENPVQIEAGEREGVEGLRVKLPMKRDDDIEAIYTVSNRELSESWALRHHYVRGDYDFTVIGGRISRESVAGFTFDGYAGGGGLRGELLGVDPVEGDPYMIWAIGGDYSFPKDLTVTLEFLYNGGVHRQTSIPLSEHAIRQFGITLVYKPKPLLTASLFYSNEPKGGSSALCPRLSWDVQQDQEITIGGNFFSGPQDSEYGPAAEVLFLQAKFYF